MSNQTDHNTAEPAADAELEPQLDEMLAPSGAGASDSEAPEPRPDDSALYITVVGHQWWWEYRYETYNDRTLGFTTAGELHMPTSDAGTHRPVYLRLQSADVCHSFWVPRIIGKRDVLPQPRTAEGENPRATHLVFTVDETGAYRGQCAEYCGEAHAIMAMQAVVVQPAEFDAWVTSMKDTPALPPGEPAADVAGHGERGGMGQVPDGAYADARIAAADRALPGDFERQQVGPDEMVGGDRTIGSGASKSRPRSLGLLCRAVGGKCEREDSDRR